MIQQSCFIFGVQMLFNILLYTNAGLKFVYQRDSLICMALFFTVLLLHLVSLKIAADGINMMKYCLVHPDEFTHPVSAFILGVFVFFGLILTEFANMANNQLKVGIVAVINGFIGYRLIMDIPTIYMNSYENLPIKAHVGKLEMKHSRTKSEKRARMTGDWFFNFVYVTCCIFYKSFFFYFFPFVTILQPMLHSLEGNVFQI
mmetsp:Transcript_4816/g.8259  ORF Transcript_4816/g.8259 Transcript_4816/m.8259 type:complete len:202 (-) Transcript_4816:33-638(-)